MNAMIQINQEAIVKHGFDIDLVDGAIINTIMLFSQSGATKSMLEKGVIYYWLSHRLICDQLPMLKTKPDTIYRRMKRLCEYGFFKAHGANKQLNGNWYQILPKCDLLLI